MRAESGPCALGPTGPHRSLPARGLFLLCEHICMNLVKLCQTFPSSLFKSSFPLPHSICLSPLKDILLHQELSNGKTSYSQITYLVMLVQLDIHSLTALSGLDRRAPQELKFPLTTGQQVNPGEFQLQERKMCYLKEFLASAEPTCY